MLDCVLNDFLYIISVKGILLGDTVDRLAEKIDLEDRIGSDTSVTHARSASHLAGNTLDDFALRPIHHELLLRVASSAPDAIPKSQNGFLPYKLQRRPQLAQAGGGALVRRPSRKLWYSLPFQISLRVFWVASPRVKEP